MSDLMGERSPGLWKPLALLANVPMASLPAWPNAHACTLPVLPCCWLLYFSSISELDLKAFLLVEQNLTPKKMVVIRKTSARASRTQPPAVASSLARVMPRKLAWLELTGAGVAGKWRNRAHVWCW